MTNIALEEELGRGVFSGGHAKRARRARVPFRVFLAEKGNTKISVDRLTVAPLYEATKISSNVATARKSTFHGWAIVAADKASTNGRCVIATPSPTHNNPYHADIVLPKTVAQDLEEQRQHAQELADASRWQERPDAG